MQLTVDEKGAMSGVHHQDFHLEGRTFLATGEFSFGGGVLLESGMDRLNRHLRTRRRHSWYMLNSC